MTAAAAEEAGRRPVTHTAIHHAVVVVRDLEAVEATLGWLARLRLGGPPRRVTQPTPNGPITIATVRDPDGLLMLLTPGSITRARPQTQANTTSPGK